MTDSSKCEKLLIPLPVIVEGKYDKMKLTSVIDAVIITTDGFGIFKKKEKVALIKKLSERGVILLCDSDGAGGVIRRRIMDSVPKEKIYNLYIPKIEGKERRKKAPSKEGTLGVEGMDEGLLREMFSSLAERLGIDTATGDVGEVKRREAVTKADLYEFGLTGGRESAALRDRLCEMYGLPDGMTPNALLGALNILTDRAGFVESAERLKTDTED